MRYSSVFLVSFYYPESGVGERLNYPPLGVGYLSEYLESQGVQTRILDMGTGKKMDQAEDLMSQNIEKFKPTLLGISLNSICFQRSVEIISNIHKKYPELPIVVGGPDASSKGVELLKKYNFLDYVIVREGEKPLAKLCLGEKFKEIPGLSWGQGSAFYRNPDMPTEDLSEFPFPKYKRFQLDLYANHDGIGILTSRGCPYQCIFCQQSSLLGKRWRARTPESIVEEISYWKNQGKKAIYILDDNFALNKQRVLKLSELVAERGLNDLEYILVGGLRIDQANRETLLALKRMGVTTIPFGVESGSDRILKFIKKGIMAEMADKAIALAVGMGFKVKLFFIIGFPIETMEDVQKSFDLALKYSIADIRFFNLFPYPDTVLMKWLKENRAHFFYQSDEYMNDYKRFQRIPIFEHQSGMNYQEKLKALNLADEVIRTIKNRCKGHI